MASFISFRLGEPFLSPLRKCRIHRTQFTLKPLLQEKREVFLGLPHMLWKCMESGKTGRGLRLRVEQGVLSGEVEAALSKQGLGLTGDLDGRQAEAEPVALGQWL